jgi:hypothetical protein
MLQYVIRNESLSISRRGTNSGDSSHPGIPLSCMSQSVVRPARHDL